VLFSSKIIGEGLFLSSRIISGAARKLINDGYLYKEGKNPVSYGITEAGAMVLPENH
jgi:predicted transcriptional regulator